LFQSASRKIISVRRSTTQIVTVMAASRAAL
jgi:hypothetical protein